MAACPAKDIKHKNGRRRALVGILLIVWLLGITAFILAIHYMSPMTNHIARVPGAGNHLFTEKIAGDCHRSDPLVYGYGECSRFISCVLDGMGSIGGSDIGQGATLAGLLPTIFIFIG